jgi:aminopeptidase N
VKYLKIIFLSFIFYLPASPQTLPGNAVQTPYNQKKESYGRAAVMQGKTSASGWFDVTYYRLDLNISAQTEILEGNVLISGKCTGGGTSVLTLDLKNSMQIDSVITAGGQAAFAQYNDSFDITLPSSPTPGEALSVKIYYHGTPVPTGFGSFIFSSHSGVPWIYSLSEPYGAKDWWPCKDDPGDKADSADIIITCDSSLKAASEGTLVSESANSNGTTTYGWRERYPIASYLISVAITNYIVQTDWFRYSPMDSMPIINYLLPENYSYNIQNLTSLKDMLTIYSEIFGLYPFIAEKYGHAEIGSGSAMEHQTLTSITTITEDIVAHELAHQWFGDMITCRTWADLWLNEGFAEYSTAIYRERKYGVESYNAYMRSRLTNAMYAKGAIGVPDFSSVPALFDSRRIYAKGAAVLHMLRHVLGDTLFFTSLNTYANSPTLKYSTASIADFQTVCQTVSGKDLSYFFQEWIYGQGYPEYIYSWSWKTSADTSSVALTIKQAPGENYPAFYTMPVDIRISRENGDTLVTVWDDAPEKTFSIKTGTKPLDIVLDPDGWILKHAVSENDFIPTGYLLEQNYPNPFNSGTIIAYNLPRSGHVMLKIYDLLGQEIETIVDRRQYPGKYEYLWNPQNIASGIYLYRLMTQNVSLQKKMIYLK